MLIKKHFILLLLTVLIFSCETDNNDNNNDYNRSDILLNWVDNIINPAYDTFYNSLLSLNENISSFNSNPNSNSLDIVSNSWLESYKIWQHIEMFDIGLAEVINYKGKMNIYPVDKDLVDENIVMGNYDLNNNNNFDARGFPALDYMLHGLADNNEELIDIYMTDSSYGEYLVDLINNMVYNTNLIIADWVSFRDSFIKNFTSP